MDPLKETETDVIKPGKKKLSGNAVLLLLLLLWFLFSIYTGGGVGPQ
jgi:hypothetical protein